MARNFPIMLFLSKGKYRDSLTKLIDTDRELYEREMIGRDSIYGSYEGSYFYHLNDKQICKIVFRFLSDSSGVKVFYFYNDSLVKLINKKTILYCINSVLRKESSEEKKTSEAAYLLYLQNNHKRVLKLLMPD
jgi:hypothetical protein